MMITVIGRGHSGTRAMSHTLQQSGVFMGAPLNESGDLIPAEDLYEACRVLARYVRHEGGKKSTDYYARKDHGSRTQCAFYLGKI